MNQLVNGPIHVSTNGRYLVDASGAPFFWLGDTAWPLYAQYTRIDAENYLANRANRGFTVIQGVLSWGGGTGFEGRNPGPNAAGDLPWLNQNPATPNDVYFQHVDHIAHVAATHGLILAMLPTWGYYVNDVGTFTPENAHIYGEWLGRRYKAQPNIIWVNGGDRLPTGHEETYHALARGLRSGDDGAHLITYHPCGWTHSSQYFHQSDWLDFNMIQTWTEWAKVYPAVAYDFALLPTRPVILAEGAYENGPEYPQGPITPLIVRRQAWWAYMAGGYSTYGQNEMWRMQSGWVSTYDTPAAIHMGIYKDIATSRDWWERVPDQGMFASGVSSERTLNAAVRSPQGDWAMIYLSSQCHVQIHMDKLQTRHAQITLVNPATGEKVDGGIHETGNLSGSQFPQARLRWLSTPSFWEDAIVLIDAVM